MGGNGSCQIADDCISSRNYPAPYDNQENCMIIFKRNVVLTFNDTFDLEPDNDFLKFNAVPLRSRPDSGAKTINSGTVMTFTSDESTVRHGFKFCVAKSNLLFLSFRGKHDTSAVQMSKRISD